MIPRRFVIIGVLFVVATLIVAYPTRIYPYLHRERPTPVAAVKKEPESPSYIACGCGCCRGVEPREVCVANEEELAEKSAEDKLAAAAESCAYAGCAAGTIYRICE